jgi:NarL family two-component system sensor histidine kinase LiaS
MRLFRTVRWYQQLRWRLTLLYVGVTIGLILAAVVVGGFFSYFRYRSLHQPAVVAAAVAGPAQELAPYVESSPVNVAALSLWLKEQNEKIQNGTGSWRGLSFYSVPSIYSAVAGARGEILAESSEGRRPLAEQRGAPTNEVFIRAALEGETSAGRLSAVEGDGTVVAAAPIKGGDGRPVGALLYRAYAPFDWDVYWGKVARGLATQLLMFITLALTVGIGFGLMTTRRLVKRLGVISTAADEWARGNFSASVSDRSADELGRLAGRLNSMAVELKDMLALRQELAGMEERNRLARDLHDTVKQQVFALGMQIGAAQAVLDGGPEQARKRLAEAGDLVRQIQQELITIIRELQPVSQAGKGFEQTLREHAENWSRQSGVAAEVQFDEGLALAPEAEHAFLRITQEALSNISRHGRATRATVRLGQGEDGGVTLTVTDDGTGFDAERVNGGMGLRNMRERAEALPGGWFRVESEKGKGARVTAGARSAQRAGEINHV